MKRDTNRHLLRSSLLGCFAFLLLLNTANAQENAGYRADSTFFFSARYGVNSYGGDRDINPFDETQNYIENIGFLTLGLEVGYSFTNRFSLSLHHLSGRYPRIEDIENDLGQPFSQPAYGNLDQSTTSKWRHHFTLLGRAHLLPNEGVSPYGQLGFNVSFGKINDQMEFGVGPMAGIGFDAYVTDQMGIFFELDGIFIFDDEALDLADTRSKETPNAPRSIDASDFDVFTILSIGLRFNARLAFVPVRVVCDPLLIPTTLIPDESGTYAANVNPDATQPVEVYWDFDDGTTASGRGPHRHSFANPDSVERTYDVTVTASNGKSTDTAVCPVKILARPRCAIRAIPDRFDTCEQPLPPVQFRSTVTGTLPITYRWDFGEPDATSTQAEPSHIYPRTDLEPRFTRTATLSVSNTAGSATCTAQVDIRCPCNPDLILPARFAQHESVIPGQARQNLQDNLNSLRANPLAIVVVEGSAQSEERNAQALADDRARAVAQFYIQGGIDRRRIVIIGLVKRKGAVADPFSTQTRLFCDRSELDKHLAEQRQQFQEQD